MKTLLGLLLVALTTYTNADLQNCRDRAIDIAEQGPHSLSFAKFMEHQDKQNEEKFYIPWATINPKLTDKKYDQFCSGSTYSYENCGVTYYERSIENGNNVENPSQFLSNLKLYSHSKLTGKVTLLKMDVEIATTTDYIFRVKKTGTVIDAYSQDKPNEKITVLKEIKDFLEQPYALYYVSTDGNISIFVSCDEELPLAWVSAKSVQIMNEEATKKIAEVLTQLHEKFGVDLAKATYVTPFNEKWSELFTKEQKEGKA